VLHPSALPIANNFYAIQRSIVECSYIGCKTIWVVCDESVAPLLKKICGDFVLNLDQHERSKFARYPKEHRTYTPVFYVPTSYKNMNKNGIAVSVMEGVYASYSISDKLSKWVVPYRYYVSMPYGVYYPRDVNLRSKIKSNESVFLSHLGQNARDNKHIGFSFSGRQFKHCSYLFKRMNVKEDYTLDKVFDDVIMSENSETHNVDYYYDISSWSGYQKMMSDPLTVDSDWRYCFNNAFKKDERNIV